MYGEMCAKLLYVFKSSSVLLSIFFVDFIHNRYNTSKFRKFLQRIKKFIKTLSFVAPVVTGL